MATPLSKVKNFGPVTLREFEAMGLDTLEKLHELGFEEVCRRWVMYFPERLHVMAFVGVITALEDTVWTKATPRHRARAKSMALELRQELGLPPTKASPRRKTTPKRKAKRSRP